jgi:hypothetical protein
MELVKIQELFWFILPCIYPGFPLDEVLVDILGHEKTDFALSWHVTERVGDSCHPRQHG